MASSSFVHLHVHSEFSLLDGACRVKDLARRAAELEMPAVALTDHGVMYGAIQFYEAAEAAGVKPIIGCELYVAIGGRTGKETLYGRRYYHLLLLAKDITGYQNLLKLVSVAHLEGYYYKPRVDRETLQAHSDGLIALSGCLAGEVPQHVLGGEDKLALRAIGEHQEIFGRDGFYLELQHHDIDKQMKVNQFLLDASAKTGAPLVATNDVHYLRASDTEPHDVLLCIQTGATRSEKDRLKYTPEYYFKEASELAGRFADYPGALERTVEIAERCNLKLEFNRVVLPDLAIPENRAPEEHLTLQAWEGLERLYPDASPEIRERLQYELDTIIKCDFAKYLLIVQDFANFARSRSILAGVRGSAAGSLVCRCLGITTVDPIQHQLTFERFLNPERIQMPDVDFDFQDDRRGEVIEYVAHKYGEDHVAQIVTFGTLGAKAAIRDAGRAMEVPLAEADRIAKMVPSLPVGITIEQAMEANPDLRMAYESSEQIKSLIDMARSLEGISRHSSTHAAGVIISKLPLVEHAPLQRSNDGALVVQYTMNDCDKIGLLKMDFLGLINLSIIQKCLDLVKVNRGVSLELLDIPLDDSKAYALLATGETTGTFQLESDGMRRYVKELKPHSVAELAAMVALYRPGPMAHIPRYIGAKFGRRKIRYIHHTLEPILAETYGVIVYQDQVLRIVQAVAGFSLGKADILRRAMGKKDAKKMAQEREHFLQGAVAGGMKEEIAAQIFDLIEPFAGYAFNKAHAVCYGTIAYQTAYLKANYPVEYLTALLACHAAHQDKVALYVEEARRMGINILPPDINNSGSEFTIGEDGKSIRFGLSAIKNCGRGMVDALRQDRLTNGPFESLADFVYRASKIQGFNRAAFECLAKAGALESLHKCRRALVEGAEEMLTKVSRSIRSANAAQGALFDAVAESGLDAAAIAPPPVPDYPLAEILAMEKDLLGLYVSDHPLTEHLETLKKHTDSTVRGLLEREDNSVCTIGGVITAIKTHLTKKKQEKMAFLTVEDLTGSTRVTVFPSIFSSSESSIRRDALVLVKAKVQHLDSRGEEGGKVDLVCESISPLLDAAPLPPDPEPQAAPEEILDGPGALTIRLEERNLVRLHLLKDLLQRHPGDSVVFFKIGEGLDAYTIRSGVRVAASAQLAKEIQKLLGVRSLVMADA